MFLKSLFLFNAEWCSIILTYNNCSVHSPVDEYLDWFQYEAVMNKVTINIYMQGFCMLCVYVFISPFFVSGIVGSYGKWITLYKKMSNFCTVTVLICMPNSYVWEFQLLLHIMASPGYSQGVLFYFVIL